MPLAVYADVHVPAAITDGLRRHGIDVLTSQQDGTRRVQDALVLRRAAQLGGVLVTQNEDFLAIAASWQAVGWEFTGVIFAPQDGRRIGRYIEDRAARGLLRYSGGSEPSFSLAIALSVFRS